MLYFLHGQRDKARAKSQELVDSLLKKKPDASLFKVSEDNFDENNLSEYIGGQGLFSNKYIVLFDGVFERKDFKESVVKRMKEIGESENVFIFREATPDKATLGKIEKSATKVQEFEEKKEPKKESFNVFSLTDALGKRDRKALWLLYRQAKNEFVEDEQIHGILFWQVKSMIAAQASSSAAGAGLNPFVYSKSRAYAGNFKEGELRKISSDLVHLYHESRRGMHDFDAALERLILSV